MKKIISPIIYFTFIVPTFLGFIVVITFLENTVGFLFDLMGLIEIPLYVITLGSLFFCTACVVLTRFEKLLKPTVWDHLRQSVGFYVLTFAIGLKLVPLGYTSSLKDALLIVTFVIAVWAIIINAVYTLYRRLRLALM